MSYTDNETKKSLTKVLSKETLSYYFTIPRLLICKAKEFCLSKAETMLLVILYELMSHADNITKKKPEYRGLYHTLVDGVDEFGFFVEFSLLSKVLGISEKQLKNILYCCKFLGLSFEYFKVERESRKFDTYVRFVDCPCHKSILDTICEDKRAKGYLCVPYFLFNTDRCISNTGRLAYICLINNVLYNSFKKKPLAVAMCSYSYFKEFLGFSHPTTRKALVELSNGKYIEKLSNVNSSSLCEMNVKNKKSQYIGVFEVYTDNNKSESKGINDLFLSFNETRKLNSLYSNEVDMLQKLITPKKDEAEISKELIREDRAYHKFITRRIASMVEISKDKNIIYPDNFINANKSFISISGLMHGQCDTDYLISVMKAKDLVGLKSRLIKDLHSKGKFPLRVASNMATAFINRYLIILLRNYHRYLGGDRHKIVVKQYRNSLDTSKYSKRLLLDVCYKYFTQDANSEVLLIDDKMALLISHLKRNMVLAEMRHEMAF